MDKSVAWNATDQQNRYEQASYAAKSFDETVRHLAQISTLCCARISPNTSGRLLGAASQHDTFKWLQERRWEASARSTARWAAHHGSRPGRPPFLHRHVPGLSLAVGHRREGSSCFRRGTNFTQGLEEAHALPATTPLSLFEKIYVQSIGIIQALISCRMGGPICAISCPDITTLRRQVHQFLPHGRIPPVWRVRDGPGQRQS